MNAPLPVTVCMLCLNEAHHLPRSLAQTRAFAEWLVLDTGSTDGSPEIAARHGATVRHARWKGFSETRREHFAMATQPWILWIDADEVVTPELVEEIRELLSAPREQLAAGYRINRIMSFQGRWIRHGDWYPDRVMRLFKADAWSMDERAVHESVNLPGEIGRLRTELPHYSYRDWADREKRIEKYARLWAEQQAAAGRRTNLVEAAGRAAWRFVRAAVIKRGVCDGWLGVRVAWSCGREVWLKYRRLAELAGGRRG